jgi:hypothetical protein
MRNTTQQLTTQSAPCRRKDVCKIATRAASSGVPIKTKTALHVLGSSAPIVLPEKNPSSSRMEGQKSKSMMNRSYFPASPLSASFKVLNTKTARSASALPVIQRRTHFRIIYFQKIQKINNIRHMTKDEPQGKAREAYVRLQRPPPVRETVVDPCTQTAKHSRAASKEKTCDSSEQLISVCRSSVVLRPSWRYVLGSIG